MEEILASIRRIISEDDAVEGEPDAEPVAAAAAPPPVEPAVEDDDVLELTDRIDDPLDKPEALAMSDLEVVEPPPPPKPAPQPKADPPAPQEEALVGATVAAASASAFGQLERTLMMPAGGRTLEDVVREMLRPMLKQWLDENLAVIVEAQVAIEVDRITRQRR